MMRKNVLAFSIALTLSGPVGACGVGGGNGNIVLHGDSFASSDALKAPAASLFASGLVVATTSIGGMLAGTATSSSNFLQLHANDTASVPADTVVRIGSPIPASGQASPNRSTLTIISNSANQLSGLLLRAMGGVTGQFGSLFVQGSVLGGSSLNNASSAVNATFSHSSVAAVAMAMMPNTATTQQTAQHIQTALSQTYSSNGAVASGNAPFLSAEGAFLHVTSIEQAEASINSLSGQILVSSQALTFEQGGIINRSVADRLAEIDAAPERQGVWLQATGASGEVGQGGYATGRYGGAGSVAGYDVSLGDGLTAGVGTDWSHLNSAYDLQAGSGYSHTVGAMAYGRYDIGSAYVSARAGEDWVTSSTSRWAVLGASSDALASVRKDRLSTFYAETGYTMHASDWSITPLAALGLQGLGRGRINEGGAGGYGITAAAASFDQTSSQVGARVVRRWNWRGGQTDFQAYALYQRLLSGSNLSFPAAYAGVPSATFQLQGVNAPRNSGWAGVGVNTQFANKWSWFVDLNGQFTGARTNARMISAGLRFRF